MGNTAVIRGDKGQIELEILDYENAQVTDIFDSNWLRARIDVVAGPFSGAIMAGLTTVELDSLYQQLAGAVESVAGGVKFETLEGELSIGIEFGQTGVARVQADVVAYDGEKKNALHCEFATDPITLEATVQGLQRLVTQFPIQHSLRTPLE